MARTNAEGSLAEVRDSVKRIRGEGERFLGRLRRETQTFARKARAEVATDVRKIRDELEWREAAGIVRMVAGGRSPSRTAQVTTNGDRGAHGSRPLRRGGPRRLPGRRPARSSSSRDSCRVIARASTSWSARAQERSTPRPSRPAADDLATGLARLEAGLARDPPVAGLPHRRRVAGAHRRALGVGSLLRRRHRPRAAEVAARYRAPAQAPRQAHLLPAHRGQRRTRARRAPWRSSPPTCTPRTA